MKRLVTDRWAYRWFLVCQINGGLNVLPNKNLISNMGFGPDATHTKLVVNTQSQLSANKTGLLPIKHPTFICDLDADTYFLKYRKPYLYLRIFRKIKRILWKLKSNLLISL